MALPRSSREATQTRAVRAIALPRSGECVWARGNDRQQARGSATVAYILRWREEPRMTRLAGSSGLSSDNEPRMEPGRAPSYRYCPRSRPDPLILPERGAWQSHGSLKSSLEGLAYVRIPSLGISFVKRRCVWD